MRNNHDREKLRYQLECKRRVDLIFKDQGRPRFNQTQIDLRFQSLLQCFDAVMSGDLDLFQPSGRLNFQMTLSLTIVAVENDHSHFLGCLFERFEPSWVLMYRNDKSIEPLLYVGLEATPSRHRKPSAEVTDCLNRSRVLCLFKVLYHKYIFLDAKSIFDLVQTLMHEDFYDFFYSSFG